MASCCYISAGAAKSSQSNLERGQKRLRALVANELFSTLKPLSHRRNVSFSLLYRYFYSRCSHKLNFLVPTADFHSQVPPCQVDGSNPNPFPLCSFDKKTRSTRTASSSELLLGVTNSRDNACQTTTILVSKYRGQLIPILLDLIILLLPLP